VGIKRYKATTNGLRHTAISDFTEITKSTPEKSLLRPLKQSGGRNMYGRITVRWRGGGHKRMYRLIDFKRQRVDEVADVLAIEYDPNRTTRIALVQYPDQAKAYILAPLDLKVGDKVVSTLTGAAEIRAGTAFSCRISRWEPPFTMWS
jgi:large subunit ribosomal protein L2